MKNYLLILSVSLIALTSCTNEDANTQNSLKNEATSPKFQADEAIKPVVKSKITASEEVKNADLSILVIGDSLSAGYGITLEKSWVNLLKADLENNINNVVITNGSISGETTGGGLARLDDLLLLSEPDIVIIELGGNDGLRGYPVKSIRKNLVSMINKSRAAGAKVLLCGIMIPPNYGERYANAFAGLYPELANEFTVPLVPFILEGVALNDTMMQEDGIHPNELGQPTIKDNVLSALESLLTGTTDKTDTTQLKDASMQPNSMQPNTAQANILSNSPIFNLRNPERHIFSSGQPSADQFTELATAGIKHIINLRPSDELDWDESALVHSLNMSYQQLDIAGANGITPENAKSLTTLIESFAGEPVLVHCGSGNRVGALMALSNYADTQNIESAILKGKEWGLTSLEPIVREQILQSK